MSKPFKAQSFGVSEIFTPFFRAPNTEWLSDHGSTIQYNSLFDQKVKICPTNNSYVQERITVDPSCDTSFTINTNGTLNNCIIERIAVSFLLPAIRNIEDNHVVYHVNGIGGLIVKKIVISNALTIYPEFNFLVRNILQKQQQFEEQEHYAPLLDDSYFENTEKFEEWTSVWSSKPQRVKCNLDLPFQQPLNIPVIADQTLNVSVMWEQFENLFHSSNGILPSIINENDQSIRNYNYKSIGVEFEIHAIKLMEHEFNILTNPAHYKEINTNKFYHGKWNNVIVPYQCGFHVIKDITNTASTSSFDVHTSAMNIDHSLMHNPIVNALQKPVVPHLSHAQIQRMSIVPLTIPSLARGFWVTYQIHEHVQNKKWRNFQDLDSEDPIELIGLIVDGEIHSGYLSKAIDARKDAFIYGTTQQTSPSNSVYGIKIANSWNDMDMWQGVPDLTKKNVAVCVVRKESTGPGTIRVWGLLEEQIQFIKNDANAIQIKAHYIPDLKQKI